MFSYIVLQILKEQTLNKSQVFTSVQQLCLLCKVCSLNFAKYLELLDLRERIRGHSVWEGEFCREEQIFEQGYN